MSWYSVIKTVKGRRYLYKQRTWREGKRVRSESVYVGCLDGGGRTPKGGGAKGSAGVTKRKIIAEFINAQRLCPEDRAMRSMQRQAKEIERYQRETFGATAREREEQAREKALSELHAAYG